jgi:two-component system, OmpR family, response regulator CpxR
LVMAVPDTVARINQRQRDTRIQKEEANAIKANGPDNTTDKPATRAGEATCCRGERDKNIEEGVEPLIMRPKKVILCVDDNEQELSVMSFMLSTNGYRVVTATSGQTAISLFSGMQVDLVLADFAMPQMNGHQLVSRLKQIAGHVPMILLGDPQAMSGEIHSADALLAKKNCSPQELLERIKVMSARKRGPRKGAMRHTPVVTELAEAS